MIWFQDSALFASGLGPTLNIAFFDYGDDQVIVNMNNLNSLEKAVRKFREWEKLESDV
jgi:hypothetical protein